MRRVAKRVPAKPSRGAIGTAPVPADEVSRQINQDEGDICLDNDLGADWTGNHRLRREREEQAEAQIRGLRTG
jgi:hypothetical protein